MGADGHISIYDLDAIKKELSNEDLKIVKCAMVYEQNLLGKNYLTVYWGDNIYDNAEDYNDMYGYYKPDGPGYVTREKFDSIWDIIRKHHITNWEVWT